MVLNGLDLALNNSFLVFREASLLTYLLEVMYGLMKR